MNGSAQELNSLQIKSNLNIVYQLSSHLLLYDTVEGGQWHRVAVLLEKNLKNPTNFEIYASFDSFPTNSIKC